MNIDVYSQLSANGIKFTNKSLHLLENLSFSRKVGDPIKPKIDHIISKSSTQLLQTFVQTRKLID